MDDSNRLDCIHKRYFRKTINHPEGKLVHHGDCKIYRSIEYYGTTPCTCGLLHDLLPIDPDVVKIIYPNFNEEYCNQDIHHSFNGSATKEEMEEIEKLLREQFKYNFVGEQQMVFSFINE